MGGWLEDTVSLCREGDEDAVRELVARFQENARGLAAAYLHDGDLARDAVQEAFVAALERLPDLRSPEAFPAWFRQIVRTHAIRIIRRRGPELAGGESPDPPHHDTPRSRLERDEILGIVRRAFEELPPAGKETAELFYFEERSCREIAGVLRIPEGTVKRRLHDVRRRLRGILLGYIGDEPAPSSERGTDETERPL